MSDDPSQDADRNAGAGKSDQARTSDPAEAAGLLDEVRRLRRDARSARHAYWFPLVLFSLLTFLAAPFYVPPRIPPGTTAGVAGSSVPLLSGGPGLVAQKYLANYWLVALFGGVALTLLLMPLPRDLTIRGTFPFLIIAAGLWVLARTERSVGLAVIAAVYTGTALLASLYDIENELYRLGWNASPGVPNVLLPAIVLLIAGAIAFAAQRRQRNAA